MNNRTISLMMLAAALLLHPSIGGAQDEPAKYGWSFQNFTTASFSWDIYRHAMFAIPSDSSCLTAPFDCLFYSQVFETKLGKDGNCYGLSLQSLLMNNDGGHLGYCCPPSFYGGGGAGPTDPRLYRAINIMHGHQVTAASLRSFFDQFLDGHSLNATYVTPLVTTALAKEGPFIVSITKGLTPDKGGHSMIAYKMTGGGANFKIWVVDPNRLWYDTSPGNRDWYTSGSNYIECNGAAWRFRMAGKLSDWPTDGPDDAAGSPLGSGHLTVLTASVAGPTGRVPSSFGLALGDLIAKIFISSTGEGKGAVVNQIREGERRLWLPGRAGIDWDDATGIRRIVPFFPSTGSGDRGFEMYYKIGPFDTTEVDFTTGTTGATLALGDNRAYVKITCSEPDAAATLRVEGLAGPTPRVVLRGASKPITADIEILDAPEPGRTNRFYTLTAVALEPGQDLTVAIDRFRGVTVTGGSSRPTALRFAQESRVPAKNFATPDIPLVPAVGLTIDPFTLRPEPGVTGVREVGGMVGK